MNIKSSNICSIKSLYGIVNNISPQTGGRLHTHTQKIQKKKKKKKKIKP